MKRVEIITMPLAKLRPAEYNPRKDLQPGDAEYEKLRRSIQTFGYVEPIIWNTQSERVVGGHQRLKVLLDLGITEELVVVVDLAPDDEKALNLVLNKISGRWNYDKLTDILAEIEQFGDLTITGFEDYELDSILAKYDHIGDLLSDDFSNIGKFESTTFTMTFTLPVEMREAVNAYIANGSNKKIELAQAIINRVMGVI